MILLIDNYDSFTYNLYQYVKEETDEVMVVRNDEISCAQIDHLQPCAIIFSPGAGRPQDAGIMEEIIKTFYQTIPMLGICLGHQGIGEVFGASVVKAKVMAHGEATWIDVDQGCPLFQGLNKQVLVGRYHSLIIKEPGDQIAIIAESREGEIMAIMHKQYPIYGIQFHPESILTPMGKQVLRNFLKGVALC